MLYWTNLLVVGSILFAGCTSSSSTSPSDAVATSSKPTLDSRHGTQISWFAGNLDEAIASAKQSSRLVFVYWGAVWCPPCNEVKSEIFSHPKFASVMSNFVPVWLDGDSDNAQAYSDRLQVTGYPTLVLLDGDGKEVLRLAETLNFVEFEQAMASATVGSRSFAGVIERALTGQAEDADWQILAATSWYDAKAVEMTSAEMLSKRRQLADRVPLDLHGPAAVLAGKILAAGAGSFKTPSTQINAERELIRKNVDNYLAKVFRDQESARAARSVLIYDMGEILNWGYPMPKDLVKKKSWAGKWKIETRRLIDSATSEDERLSAWLAQVDAEKILTGRKELSRVLSNDIRKAVSAADRNSRTIFQRQTVIPTAAYVLQEIGDPGASRDLMQRELKRSKTPWYIYSGLAQLEEKLGNKIAALQYASQATKSVAGQASRVQWIASDLLMSIRLNTDRSRVNDLTKTFYESVFSLSDGFAGRNWSRLTAVEKQLKTASISADLRGVVTKYQSRCGEMNSEQKKRCESHFESVLSQK